jgi:hypothetical protein
MFELLINGVENGCSQEVISSAVYTLSGMIDDINEESMSNFYALWENIKKDSDQPLASALDEDESGSQHYESPEEAEAWKNLEDAMKNWRNTSAGD